jgi:peptide/nickel transport system permease protein
MAIIGPRFTEYDPFEYITIGAQPPSSEFWFGTTFFGQDVFTQFVHGLQATFLVGIIGGGIGTLIGVLVGFTAGYRGGIIDEVLNILTNIVLVLPTMAVLLIIAAYLQVRSLASECIFIGLTTWPWAARAIRAQTFSLRTRDFIDLARMSGMRSILNAATLDFIGLGPTNAISLGLMMQVSVMWGAMLFGNWWWFIPPGLAITMIVGALYAMNVGLDEVFNPKLREM